MSVVTESLTGRLAGMLELRPFPAAATRLMAACDRDCVTVRELTGIIKSDPSLAVRLLRIANSPIYGFSGEIRSIDHATVVLGMRGLRDLAISASASDMFGAGDDDSRNMRGKLLQHSLACGSIARLLVENVAEVSPDEAFLGGIIHDIGKLFILDHDPIGYSRLISEFPPIERVGQEKTVYGVAHTDVGQQCGHNWGLPDVITDMIAWHHDPEDTEFSSRLTDVIFVANELARSWFGDDEASESPNPVVERFDLQFRGTLDDVREKSEASLEILADICGS